MRSCIEISISNGWKFIFVGNWSIRLFWLPPNKNLLCQYRLSCKCLDNLVNFIFECLKLKQKKAHTYKCENSDSGGIVWISFCYYLIRFNCILETVSSVWKKRFIESIFHRNSNAPSGWFPHSKVNLFSNDTKTHTHTHVVPLRHSDSNRFGPVTVVA